MEESEYELAHFGFTSKQLSLERRRLIRSIVEQNVDDLIEALAVSQETKDFVKNTKCSFVEEIQKSFEPYLKEFDDMDVEHFSIEPHVLLPNDFDLSKEYSEIYEQKLDDEMLLLKQEFLQNAMMLASLKSEMSQYNLVKEFVEDETDIQQNIHKLIEELDVNRVTKSMTEVADILNIDS